jgi:hypothetical protein
MPFNPSPEVAAARDAAKQLGGCPVAVVVFITPDGSKLGAASYGKDKRLCGHAGGLCDHLYEAAMKWLAENGTGL